MAPPDSPVIVEEMDIEPDVNEAADEQLHALTLQQLENRNNNINPETQLLNVAPTEQQQLGTFTAFCLMTNRTIASGIFTQPSNILFLTGSTGVALTMWVVGGLITLGVLSCWNELAQTIPMHLVLRGTRWIRISTPRSGADKNWLEYIYKKPKFLMTCVFGMLFILFGNLASNALQFGVFMQTAINPDCREGDACFNKGGVIGWAIFAITLTCFVNVLTRRFSIIINNVYAVCKVTMLVVIALMGIIYGSTHGGTCRNINLERKAPGGGFGDIALATIFATFPYSGYEQPFYVHAEVRKPRRQFARTTTWTLLVVIVLFTLVNVSYLCVVPYDGNIPDNMNMALEFFATVSPASDSQGAVRGVSAVLAIFILGNMVAEAFTGSRVKQEIGKEGVFPFSIALARSNDTLLARWRSARRNHEPGSVAEQFNDHLEQAPMAATFLHWLTELILVLVIGILFDPSKGYRYLSFLKVYVIVALLGLMAVGGLLYLKIDALIRGRRGRKWNTKVKWKPWFDPLPTVLATLALIYMVFGVFVPPSVTRPSDEAHWIKPLVACSAIFLGAFWWLGLRGYLWYGRKRLVTTRLPYIEFDERGKAVQKAEFVEVRVIPTL